MAALQPMQAQQESLARQPGPSGRGTSGAFLQDGSMLTNKSSWRNQLSRQGQEARPWVTHAHPSVIMDTI